MAQPSDNIHNLFTPQPDEMLAHAEHLFGGYLGGCHDGLIELAWTDTTTHALRHARLYGTDELEELVAHAVMLNIQQGCNVYLGAALRKPGTAPFARAKDADFFALTCAYVDLDEPGAATTAKDKYGTAKPTKVVITGRTPHARAQLWWRLDEPIVDARLSEGLLKGLAKGLDGDPTVVNASRVMRLAGSVAWPVKDGRVTEMTSLITPNEPLARSYTWGHLARLFPPAQPQAAPQTPQTPQTPPIDPARVVEADGITRRTTPLGFEGEVVDGREAYMLKTITACLIQLCGGGGATVAPTVQGLFDLAWPQFSRGCDVSKPRANGQPWTAEAFWAKCLYTLQRFTEGKIQGVRSLEEAKAIHALKQAAYAAGGGKGRYDDVSSDFGPGQQQAQPAGPLILTAAQFLAGYVPPNYLIDGIVQQHYLYALTARTGHGKTAVAMLAGACVARGVPFHGRETVQGNVLFLAGENSQDVRVRYKVLASYAAFDAEATPMFFVDGVIDIAASMPRIEAEVAKIGDIAMVIVDTAAAYFKGDDANSNAQQGQFAQVLRGLIKLPGKPLVLVNCHPVKNATQDNLIPLGGSHFLNEIDGNLTLWTEEKTCRLAPHQDKWRGASFEELDFELITQVSDTVRDAKGRHMPSVVAVPITEMGAQRKAAVAEEEENTVLRLIHSHKKASFSEIAKAAGFTLANGQPYKSKVQRIVERLKKAKMIYQHRGARYRLTKKGCVAAGLVWESENKDD